MLGKYFFIFDKKEFFFHSFQRKTDIYEYIYVYIYTNESKLLLLLVGLRPIFSLGTKAYRWSVLRGDFSKGS